MKIALKTLDDDNKNDCTYVKPIKFSKKTKGSKIPIKDPNLHDSPERTKPKTPKTTERTKIPGQTTRPFSSTDQPTKDGVKAQRKQESEWKPLKKVDYQRLETVVEEGQFSSEESPSKPTCTVKESESESQIDGSAKSQENNSNAKKPKCNNLISIEENTENLAEEDDFKLQKIDKTPDIPKTADCTVEALKEKIISSEKSLGGMMEIFPIFSNDKFLCSRDAISIEESEELDVSEKNVSHPKPNMADNKTVFGGSKKSPSPKESGDSSKISEKIVRKKESYERKLRHKILTDKKIVQKTSSHFINTLLMLDSFEEVRKNLIRGDALLTSGDEVLKKRKCSALYQMKMRRAMRLFPAVILTTIGVLSICLGFAWRAYEPPRWIDYLLQFLPFRHRRSRTLVQQFFDYLLKSLFLFCGIPLK